MGQHIAIIDGEHRVKDIEDVIRAYYTEPQSKYAQKFKQELQKNGYVVRTVGRCANQPNDVLFKAERTDEGYAYQCVLGLSNYKIMRPHKKMCTIIDGVHITDNIETLLLAYYFNLESPNIQYFLETLEKNGYVVRDVGDNHAEDVKVCFQAKKEGTKFYYRNIIVRNSVIPPMEWDCTPASTGGKVVFRMHGHYRI